MPYYEHENLGDVQAHTFMKGTITSVNSSDDTADVTVPGGSDGSDVPLFYHCDPDSAERSNGAIKGAAGGFSVGDDVIVMCSVGGEPVRVVGHTDGLKKCGFLIKITCMLWCVVWDFGIDDYATGVTWNSSELTGHPVDPEHDGGPVLNADWPVDGRFISQWVASKEIDQDAKELFSMDWDADPTVSGTSTHNIHHSWRNDTWWGYFGWACYPWWDSAFTGKHDTIIQCDGRMTHPNVRKWSFLGKHESVHIRDNHGRLVSVQGLIPHQPYWTTTVVQEDFASLSIDS